MTNARKQEKRMRGRQDPYAASYRAPPPYTVRRLFPSVSSPLAPRPSPLAVSLRRNSKRIGQPLHPTSSPLFPRLSF